MNAIAQIPLMQNVEYVLRDRDGNVKQLWNNNKLGAALLETFRYLAPNPQALKLSDGRIVDDAFDFDSEENEHLRVVDSFVKPGRLNKLAIDGIRIPGVTGFWSDKLVKRNLITSAGKAGAASRINGSGAEAAFTYIAVGTGTTAAAVGNTTLETELAASGLSRAAATASRVTTSVTNDTAQLLLTFTVTGTAAVTESGVLNAAAVGVLLARQVFSAINVVNGDSLQITWKFQCS